MTTQQILRRERGITLLELIVGLLLASIVASAVAQFYVSQHYHVNQQRDVSDVQQNLRSAMQEITEQLRMAGYGMPSDMDPIVAYNTNPDTVMFYYRKSPTSRAELSVNMPSALDELQCDGFDLTEFKANTWAYIFDPNAKSGEFFYMSGVDNSTQRIAHTINPLSKAYPSGSEVLAVEIYKYYLDRTDPARPNLVRSRQGEGAVVFSEGIDSLQFSYQLTSGAWSDAPAAGRLIRSVQITMGAVGDNDAEGAVGGTRHRSLTTQVNIRNLAL